MLRNVFWMICASLASTIALSGCATVEKQQAEYKIKTAVYKNNEKLSYCYKQALEQNENLEGTIEMQWDVSYANGQERIQNVSVAQSTVRSEDLANCMKKVVGSMRFDLPGRADRKVHRVSYPFVFKKDESMSLKK